MPSESDGGQRRRVESQRFPRRDLYVTAQLHYSTSKDSAANRTGSGLFSGACRAETQEQSRECFNGNQGRSSMAPMTEGKGLLTK